MHSGLSALLTSISVIAVFVLAAGGIRLLRTGERIKGVLMLVASLVLVINVLIWSWTPAH
jgi:hypothetical protein